MSTLVHFHKDHCVVQYTGKVTIEETMDVHAEIAAYRSMNQIQYLIADCRELTEVDYSPNDYDIHATISKHTARLLQRNIKAGIVVADEKAKQNIVKIVESLKSYPQGWIRKVFFDYDEAVAWASS